MNKGPKLDFCRKILNGCFDDRVRSRLRSSVVPASEYQSVDPGSNPAGLSCVLLSDPALSVLPTFAGEKRGDKSFAIFRLWRGWSPFSGSMVIGSAVKLFVTEHA